MSERSLSTGKTVTLIIATVTLAILGPFVYMQFSSEAQSGQCEPGKGVLTKFMLSEGPLTVPDNIFHDNDQKERRLSNYLGRGLVLNFWATWCTPCIKEMPNLDRLRAILKSSDIDVLAVSEDRKGLRIVRKFYAANNLKELEILIDPKGKLLQAAGGRGLPTTILIDQQGYEVGRLLGVADWDAPETIRFLKRCLGS